VSLFGHDEHALRLVPFLAAVAVLPLFFRMVRRMSGNPTAIVAIALIALAEPLVRYCAEAKQYSTDVLWTTVAVTLALGAESVGGVWALAIAGAILIWFSHPLVFVLGGIGLTLFLRHLVVKKYRLVVAETFMAVLWLASFGVNYLLISRYYVASDWLHDYWVNQHSFAPIPDSVRNLLWYPKTLISLFDYPLGILPTNHSPHAGRIIAWAAVGVFIVGIIVMWRRYRPALGYLLGTMALALIASGLQRYPLEERLTLFCAPLVVLPLAFALGLDWWRQNLPRAAAWLAICAVIFLYPLYIQAKYVVHPEVRYDAKPAIQYVKAHWQPGDLLYLHWGSDVLGKYYLKSDPALNVPPDQLITGVYEKTPADREKTYAGDLLKVQGRPRVWIVFSMDPIKDRQMIEQILDRRGKRLVHERFNGSTADLYDLR
jgi:4-amino-4-deoxy-L-arabinose transferase-like glycosyltransferase